MNCRKIKFWLYPSNVISEACLFPMLRWTSHSVKANNKKQTLEGGESPAEDICAYGLCGSLGGGETESELVLRRMDFVLVRPLSVGLVDEGAASLAALRGGAMGVATSASGICSGGGIVGVADTTSAFVAVVGAESGAGVGASGAPSTTYLSGVDMVPKSFMVAPSFTAASVDDGATW